MKTATTSPAKLLPIFALLFATHAANAFVISFNNVSYGNTAVVTSTAGPGPFLTLANTSAANGTNATPQVSYTASGDLDGDGIASDTITVLLNVTANNSKNPSQGTANTSGGFGTAAVLGNGELVGSSGDAITFTYAGVTATTFSSGRSVDTAKPFDFTSVTPAGNGTFAQTTSSISGSLATTPEQAFTMTATGGRGGPSRFSFQINVVQLSAVPEPSPVLMIGMVGVLGFMRRSR